MSKIYDRWPEIAKESYESSLDSFDLKEIDHIVFSGMGGSGAIGDILASILSKTKIHISVTKGYLLPKTADPNTLVVTTSISGNTAETLEVLDSANKLGSRIIAFSSGGKMEKYCIEKKIEHRKIPLQHSPRASFPRFLYSMLRVLGPKLQIKNDEVNDSITRIENLREQISSLNLTSENPSLSLAEYMSGIPLIYYPRGLQASAIRFKNSIQENSKSHAIIEDMIEACHNGIMAWEKKANVKPILIQGEDDYIKTKERWRIIKEFFETNNIEYKEVFSIKGSIISKLISLVYLLDYSTIYMAVLSKIDPTPISSIDFIKNRLSD